MALKYPTKPPDGVGPVKQPGHADKDGYCWWSGKGTGWWKLNEGATPCHEEHTFGDPEPDPEAEAW